jgi:hypothetical protein
MHSIGQKSDDSIVNYNFNKTRSVKYEHYYA